MSADPHQQSQTPDRSTHAKRDSPLDEAARVAPVEPDARDAATRPWSGAGAGQQGFFVTPASYLKPLGRPQGAGAKAGAPGMGDEVVGSVGSKRASLGLTEREQVEGLVSRTRGFCTTWWSVLMICVVARNQGVSQSADMLRCPSAQLPIDRLRHWAACEEKLDCVDTMRYVSPINHLRRNLELRYGTGIVSAPLWDSKSSTFAGLLTVNDYINVIQYYWQNPDAMNQIEAFKLNSLRDVERAIGVAPIETVSIHPLRPLYEACTRLLQSRARRIPLVDIDDETQREMVVSLVTQYRILKFVSINVKETQMLRKPLRDLPDVGTYTNLATAYMETPVMDVIHLLVKRNISCVPIVDRDGTVLNVFEAVDVITLIKGGDYEKLNYSAGKALELRSEVCIFESCHA
jgi:CBS domain-containing protein